MTEHSKKHGHFCWHECFTQDVDNARVFYGDVFNWHIDALPTHVAQYTIFKMAEQHIASMREPIDDSAPHWLSYIEVDDLDVMVAKAVHLKANVHIPITVVPNIGRFAILIDVIGAKFAMWDTQKCKHIDTTKLTDPGL